MKIKYQNHQGFTLAETLMTVLLFSVISGACLMLLLGGSNAWQADTIEVEVNQQARIGSDWMKTELINSGSSTITNVPADGTWYTTITFKTATGASGGNITWSANTVQYQLSGTNLQRISGGVTKILAHNIQSLQIRRQASTPNIVEVNLRSQKNTPQGRAMLVDSNFKVKMRN